MIDQTPSKIESNCLLAVPIYHPADRRKAMSTIHHDGAVPTLGVGDCHTALQEVHARKSHLLKDEGGDGLSQTDGLLLAEIGRFDQEQSVLPSLFIYPVVLLLQFSQLSQQLP